MDEWLKALESSSEEETIRVVSDEYADETPQGTEEYEMEDEE